MTAQAATKRPLGALGRMSVVVAMHAALLVLLAQSFGIVPPVLFDRGELVTVDEPIRPVDPVPRIAEPQLVDPTISLVPPDFPLPLDRTEDPPPAVSVSSGPPEVAGAAGGTVALSVVHGARLDPRRPLSQPPYSQRDIREGIEGFVDVEVYVLADGRVGDARILRSTGSERMDQATIEEAKRRWRLLPATRDGVAFAQWYPLRVKFELKN
jgi:protein TonB